MQETLKKVWSIFTLVEQRKAIWMLLLALCMAVVETAGVISIMPFLSVLARPDIIHENPWLHALYKWSGFTEETRFITALGLASIALVISASLFKTVTQHLLNRFIHLLRHSISSRLMARYLGQPYEFFLSRNSAELSKSILAEVDMLMGHLVQPMSQVITQGIIVLAMLGVIFLYNPVIALAIVLVVGSLYAIIYSLVRKRLRRMGVEMQAVNKERYQACNEALHGIRDIKVTHAETVYQERYSQASRMQARHLAANDTLSQTPLYLVEATGYTGLILIALALLASSGDIAQVLPALGLYGFAAYRMLPAAQVMYRGIARLKFSTAVVEHLHRDMALSVPKLQMRTQQANLKLQHAIRLEGISYAYPSAPEKAVLCDFHLSIPANTSMGIAGASGAGKSTLMDILLGLLQPQTGQIYVDDVAITSENLSLWHQCIGYVPQQIYLADVSVAENIAFGVSKAEIDMQAVERAARIAQIHDFVEQELPQGYSTLLGDRGLRLSGGQRQRIGIARALYRDPPVLLMDEATSALDIETENLLNSALKNLVGKKTVIIIAHREASLKACANILQIKNKTIIS